MPPDPREGTDATAVRTDVVAVPPVASFVIPESESSAHVSQPEVEAEVEVEVRDAAAEAPVEEQGREEQPATPPAVARPEHAADPARRRRMMPWAIAACALVTLGAIAIGLSYTPLVAARTVSVTGERHLSEGQVLRIARLGEGTNLIHVDLAAAEARLERNPWVAEATVERGLPHTLRISVVERTPVAMTSRPNGALAFVATDGTMMGSAAEGSPLPAIVATDGELPAPADVLGTGAVGVGRDARRPAAAHRLHLGRPRRLRGRGDPHAHRRHLRRRLPARGEGDRRSRRCSTGPSGKGWPSLRST